MIQFLIIIAGFVILGIIFARRYLLLTNNGGSFLARRKDLFKYFHHLFEKSAFEATVDEIIPDMAAIDPKKIARADSFLKRAEIYLEKDDLKNGEQALIQSLTLNPGCKEIYHRLGLFYLKQGQFGKAEIMYRKLITAVTDDPVYFSNLGLALYQQKKLDEARKFYLRAIELDGSRAGRFFSLGQIYHELNQLDEALHHFLKAIALDYKNIDYLLTLAQLYYDRGQKAELRKTLEEILAFEPNNKIALEMANELSGVETSV